MNILRRKICLSVKCLKDDKHKGLGKIVSNLIARTRACAVLLESIVANLEQFCINLHNTIGCNHLLKKKNLNKYLKLFIILNFLWILKVVVWP